MLASCSGGQCCRCIRMGPKKVDAKAKAAAKKAAEKTTDADQGVAGHVSNHSAKGEGMDPAAVSRMLGLLKYRSNPETNKKGEDIEEAKQGLEIYQGLAASEKKQFLEEFETQGRGKKKGSLGFVLSYRRKFSQ